MHVHSRCAERRQSDTILAAAPVDQLPTISLRTMAAVLGRVSIVQGAAGLRTCAGAGDTGTWPPPRASPWR